MKAFPPTDELIRLAYVSTLLSHLTDGDVAELVAEAASKNISQEITGVLAIEGNRVCQILEGSREAVEQLFASILQDDRHNGVTVILNQPIKKSSFDAWGMVQRKMVDIVIYAMTT